MAQIGLIRNLSDSLIINYGNPQENNIGMIVGFKLYVLKLLKILFISLSRGLTITIVSISQDIP